jgi:uncharacterized paraquat-inducible protein A
MPYLRCPNCGLLAHVIPAAHAHVLNCPRCRAHEQEIPLAPLEDSNPSPPHEESPKLAR